MHAYSRYVKSEMDLRDWNQNELSKRAGLTRQVISSIVNDSRDRLTQVPDDKTIDGLATAFRVQPEVVRAHVALAMGLPVSIERADVTAVSDAELIQEIARRLKAGESGATSASPMNQAGDDADEVTQANRGRLEHGQQPVPNLDAVRRRQEEADTTPPEVIERMAADRERDDA